MHAAAGCGAASTADLRAEYQHLHAGALEHVAIARREVVRAEPIEQQVHGHAAGRGARKRRRHQAAGLVVGKDVGLDEYLAPRGIDGVDQRREILLAVPEQRKAVAGDVLQRHRRQIRFGSAMSALSAR